ncbi:sensor histidine kinase [Nonomuraea sp. NPDC050536]|uniref:sensor histidine kinase n=1 Tax=Nonomuraea sp. NPDC050536 TaxID=3364366 RepID=UPI0037C5618E
MSDLPVVEGARRWVRALPPLWVDGALAVLVLVAQMWPFLTQENDQSVAWSRLGYVVVVVASVPVVWRRRAPIATLLVSLIAISFYDVTEPVPSQPVWYSSLIGLYTVAVYSRRWPRLIVVVLSIGGMLLLVGSSTTAIRGILGAIAAYAIGRATATSRAHAATLAERAEHLDLARRLEAERADHLDRARRLEAERAERLERERAVEAERAAERERARIARDMHDILAHAVSLMVVQAEAGPVVVRSDPDRAEAAFDAIAAAGRDAMEQLRRMLGVLKDKEESPRAPQPTIDDLPALIAGTGLEVDYTVSGIPGTLPPDTAVAAYRITQEALTNIVKHSGADRAEITLTWEDDTLMIDITDDGHGAARALPSGGNGLIGIRERAAACGGTATAGPRADGRGFRVTVRLPLARP